ncbi:DNA methyltransferase [Thermodesulfovibrio yellowstonii]|uniref:site-specific DNA-methyltransferase (adenine-specific) n=1 Tax=Thermodesulfovibrio yellowstonii TaxID=28262 RepID=A0A9W6GFE1_9BACT|nr:DNA methyltransferase [Thermodesulfovibrio islandicus]GLI52888.1 DNA methylase [Thermodesulfovibrio islandicus]
MEIKKSCIFACTNKSEKECLSRKLFGTNSIYGEKVFSIKKGDLLFLLNIDTDILYGPFIAESDGSKNIEPDAWNGRYPYQVKISENGEIKTLKNAKKIFNQLNIDWHTQIIDPARTEILLKLLENPELALSTIKLPSIVTDEKPKLEATTLWDYPKQSYGKTPKGDNKYPGVTPAFIIYNLIRRYTEPGDLVLDPMAGSGTTLDVCKEEGRRCIAYDIAPTRPDIIQNDARNFPLDDNSIDMIFVDSPYGDNIKYNEHPDNIGNISAETEEFYQELEKVMKECYRVLKPGKVLAWLIGDQWVKKKFTPVGFKVFERLCKHFEPVDIICVARRGQTSNTGIWYNRAIRFNFYLRGFKYLHIMRKPCVEQGKVKTNRKINWTHYERKR